MATVNDTHLALAAAAVNTALPELRHHQVAQAIADVEERTRADVRAKVDEYAGKCRADAAKHAEAGAQHLQQGAYPSAMRAVQEAEVLRRLAAELEYLSGVFR